MVALSYFNFVYSLAYIYIKECNLIMQLQTKSKVCSKSAIYVDIF